MRTARETSAVLKSLCHQQEQLGTFSWINVVLLIVYQPMQVVLFPVNPDLQVQSYEPSVFIHSALSSQSAVSASHSLMSKLK